LLRVKITMCIFMGLAGRRDYHSAPDDSMILKMMMWLADGTYSLMWNPNHGRAFEKG
jgi:hypothetical protein